MPAGLGCASRKERPPKMRAVKSRLLPSKTIDGARALVGHAEADGTAKGELGPDPADRGCHGDVGRRLRVSQQASKQASR